MFKIVKFSHLLMKEFLQDTNNIIALDATCGRGNDTLALATILKDKGIVHAYDIQEEAINSTKELITSKGLYNVVYFNTSHEEIDPSLYKLSIFNLGYLPNGDKTITTNSNTTLNTIKKLLDYVLINDSLIIICLYVGHEEGKKEASVIDNYLVNLDSKKYLVTKYLNYNRPTSPYILTISKNKRGL